MLLYFIVKDSGVTCFANYKTIGFLYLFISIIFILLGVRGKLFVHYDNYSHWALVVKQMLSTNRYPNFEDASIISFQEYPLGSATYVYFMATLVGKSESIQMFAQAYMMLVCLLPLFINIKRNKMLSCILMLFMTNFLFVFNIKITDLLVDTLLPIVSMCALFYIYQYSCDLKEYKVESYMAIFYMIQMLQIKNSGIFFTAIASLCILTRVRKDKMFLNRILAALIPYGTLVIWQRHCSYVFTDAAVAKHAMTAENYREVFAAKTAEDIDMICCSLLKFSFTEKNVWFFVMCAVVVATVCFLWAKKDKRDFKKLVLFNLLLYVAYQLGMLFMYLYSMPKDEALIMAGADRYCNTILIAIFYSLILFYFRIVSGIDMKGVKGVVSVGMMVSVISVWLLGSLGRVETVFSDETDTSRKKWVYEREWMQNVIGVYNVPKGQSYCILVDDSDSSYTYYLGKYVLQSNYIYIPDDVAKDTLDFSTIQEKYILIYDKNNVKIQDWIALNYPDCVGDDVIIREDG